MGSLSLSTMMDLNREGSIETTSRRHTGSLRSACGAGESRESSLVIPTRPVSVHLSGRASSGSGEDG